MTSLYDDLGVAPDASAEDLRKAYRGLARQLHPDVSDGAGNDEHMRRLNRAWAVLGNPSARAGYDRAQGQASDRPSGRPDPAPLLVVPAVEPLPSLRWLRPSVVAVSVLIIIFIVTAYAGPHAGGPHGAGPAGGRGPATVAVSTTQAGSSVVPANPTPTPAPPGAADSGLVGKCLLALPGYDAVVPCSGRNDGLVVGQSPRSADCGTSTTVHQLAGRSMFVCLVAPRP